MITLKKRATIQSAERLYGLTKPLIGLTGGIATGKSTVSKMLMARGLSIIDADQLVKAAYTQTNVLTELQVLAPSCFGVTGEVDFKKLRALVFNDSNIKAKIEQLIYAQLPALFNAQASQVTQDFIIYDAPLLFEKQLASKFDYKVLVYAPQELQLERLIKRDQIEPELALQMLKGQESIEVKKKFADYVIENQADEAKLAEKVQDFLSEFFNLT